MSPGMLLCHGYVTSADVLSDIRWGRKLDTKRDHVEKADDVDYGNLCSKLMLSEHSSENSQKLKGPPLGTLHHGRGDAKLQEFLGPLPIKRIAIEKGLQELAEVLTLDQMNV